MNLADIRHCVRVANLSMSLADVLNLPQKEKEELYISALFHDIGKAFLNQEILNKPGPLTDLERKHIETHSVFSYRESKNVGFSKVIADNILYHHENFDGTGYPLRINGSKIPLASRIIKITDTFDALTCDRPYRKALSAQEALRIMNKQRSQYDPQLYLSFTHLLDGSTKNFEIYDYQRTN